MDDGQSPEIHWFWSISSHYNVTVCSISVICIHHATRLYMKHWERMKVIYIYIYFIFVGCILLRYLYVYFQNIPTIATDSLDFFIVFCLFTTCFGPYGPSSGETQHHLYIYESYHTTAYPLQLFACTVHVSYCLFIYLHSYNGNSFN
jgi:hypothetical protein